MSVGLKTIFCHLMQNSLEFDNFTTSSATSATQSLDIITVSSVNDSAATPEFSGPLDGFQAELPAEEAAELDPKVKLQCRTPIIIPVADTIGRRCQEQDDP